jgi:ABC-type multidrug transport system permease subunit
MYINTSPGANYGYLYQYISEPGGNSWVEVLKLNPTIYSKLHTVTFASGTSASMGNGAIVIPITDISTATGLSAENFSIQYSIQNANPIASSLSSVQISGTDLIINIEASEYDGTWGPLDIETSVHIFIAVVL